MGLVRAWVRQMLRVWGVAAAAPVALIAAIAVIASTGGFGQLGSLGQVLAGPSLRSPGGDTGGGAGSLALARSEPRVLHPGVVRPGRSVAARPSRPARAGGQGASGGAGSSAGAALSGGSSPTGGSGTGGSSGGSGSGSGGGGGGGSGLTGQISQAVGSVADTAASVASRLPAPVGTPASQTIRQVGGAVQSAIPGGSGAQIRILTP